MTSYLPPTVLPRRRFLLGAAATLCSVQLPAQTAHAHTNVAELDHDTIERQAQQALSEPIEPPLAPIFRTTLEVDCKGSKAGEGQAAAVRLRGVSARVAALTAGFLATQKESFRVAAIANLQPWFFDPATSLQPNFSLAGLEPGKDMGAPAGIMDLVPLAELARSVSFLTDTLTVIQNEMLQTWFETALEWFTKTPQALLARDKNDHRASAYVLISTALARSLRKESMLEENRKRFRQLLRHQIRSDGVFPQEVTTSNPYRNTLMNFDLLGGACQLLSSSFESLWELDLIDGVGMRSVAAFLYPVITHPERWTYPADADDFRSLPGRRPALLFAGRAYSRPEYVSAWLATPAVLPPPALAASFPIQQPALWTARAPHGL